MFNDRVKETTTTTGTGTITLAGAVAGFQSFNTAFKDGQSVFYAIVGATEWEVGQGIFTASGTTLSRQTIFSSSNGNAKVTFSAGAKDVFCTFPGALTLGSDASTNFNKSVFEVTPNLDATTPALVATGFPTSNMSATYQSNPTAPARDSTNTLTRFNRIQFSSSATAGVGILASGNPIFNDNSPGGGSIFYFARFCIASPTTVGHAAFVGCTGYFANPVVNHPSNIAACPDIFGMGYGTGDTTWQIFCNDSASFTKTATGIAKDTTGVFDLHIWKPSGSSVWMVRIDKWNSLATGGKNTVYGPTVYSTSVPSSGIPMRMQLHASPKSTGETETVHIMKMHLETNL